MNKEENSTSELSDRLQQRIARKIAAVAGIAHELPGVIIIHNINDLSVVYMSPKGVEILGTGLEEIVQMGPEYHRRFFNAEESLEYVPKIIDWMARNNDQESISLFQQVRGLGQAEWTWYLTSMKIFMQDDQGKPLLAITTVLPVDPEHQITIKVARLLEENNFLRRHYNRFARLSKREKEVLRLLGLGKSSNEIAQELFISITTADTHRRNIKNKLKAASYFDLQQYARAFDLI